MRNNKPVPWTQATQARIAQSIRRRALVIAALECGLPKPKAARYAGVSLRTVNRFTNPNWRPGA